MSSQLAGHGMACTNCGRTLTCENKVGSETVGCPTCGYVMHIEEVRVA